MRKTTAVALMLLFSAFVSVHSTAQNNGTVIKRDAKAAAEIQKVLDDQAAAWNRGDIDGYMTGYANSPDTVFISGDSFTRGWQTVRDRYKSHYDSREKMGTLTFSDIDVNLLSRDSAVVSGRWLLTRTSDKPHGRFTLVFRRLNNEWRIIQDHTSSAG